MRANRILNNIKVLVCSSLFFFSASLVFASESGVLKVFWNASPASLGRSGASSQRLLRSWTLDALSNLAPVSTREKDPESGQYVQWKGVLISKWIEKELVELPLDQRSQVDLLILKNKKGQQAIIPRYVIKSVPLLLAWEKDHKKIDGEKEPLTVVVPWSTNSKVTQGNLPWGAYEISGVHEIQLTSYLAQYSPLLLKRRTDPAAIRGEKMAVENCLSCHGNGRARGFREFSSSMTDLPQLVSQGHSQGEGPQLSGRDLRAFISYLMEYRSENSSKADASQN